MSMEHGRVARFPVLDVIGLRNIYCQKPRRPAARHARAGQSRDAACRMARRPRPRAARNGRIDAFTKLHDSRETPHTQHQVGRERSGGDASDSDSGRSCISSRHPRGPEPDTERHLHVDWSRGGASGGAQTAYMEARRRPPWVLGRSPRVNHIMQVPSIHPSSSFERAPASKFRNCADQSTGPRMGFSLT